MLRFAKLFLYFQKISSNLELYRFQKSSRELTKDFYWAINSLGNKSPQPFQCYTFGQALRRTLNLVVAQGIYQSIQVLTLLYHH